MRVVDCLEMIQVGHQRAQRALLAGGSLQCEIEAVA